MELHSANKLVYGYMVYNSDFTAGYAHHTVASLPLLPHCMRYAIHTTTGGLEWGRLFHLKHGPNGIMEVWCHDFCTLQDMHTNAVSGSEFLCVCSAGLLRPDLCLPSPIRAHSSSGVWETPLNSSLHFGGCGAAGVRKCGAVLFTYSLICWPLHAPLVQCLRKGT